MEMLELLNEKKLDLISIEDILKVHQIEKQVEILGMKG